MLISLESLSIVAGIYFDQWIWNLSSLAVALIFITFRQHWVQWRQNSFGGLLMPTVIHSNYRKNINKHRSFSRTDFVWFQSLSCPVIFDLKSTVRTEQDSLRISVFVRLQNMSLSWAGWYKCSLPAADISVGPVAFAFKVPVRCFSHKSEHVCEQHNKGHKQMRVLQLALILSSSPDGC